MKRSTFKHFYRLARLGSLGTLACSAGDFYFWLLHEVYDLRFPRIGDDRHAMRNRNFDAMRHGGSLHRHLVAWHHKRGWYNCEHKSLLRLWIEHRTIKQQQTADGIISAAAHMMHP